MNIIRGKNVTKYIHTDGSETVIKVTKSMEYHPHAEGDFIISEVDRNKYSILISSSVGCQMGCKMCGIDPKTFKSLSSDEIIANVREAVTHHDFFIESLSMKYVKLCFMGRGEATLRESNFSTTPAKLIRFLVNKGYAIGVDSVDYGTILPTDRHEEWVKRVISLNTFLKEQYKVNPANNHNSVVRVFFSLHHLSSRQRKRLIPMGDPDYHLEFYKLIGANIDLIFHYTFIEDINDTSRDIGALHDFFFEQQHLQLRLLRYNPNKKYKESPYWELCWKALSSLPNVKFQVSPGKEVNSSCGMFG